MKKIILSTILIVLSFINFAHAEITWAHFDFFDNSGGINDVSAPTAIADGEAADVQNMTLSTYGSFATRAGTSTLNSVALSGTPAFTGISYYAPTSGSKYIISVADNNKIFKMDYGVGGGPDGTWDDITGTLSFAIGQDNLSSFAVGEDAIIIEDGLNSTAPYVWSEVGNAALLAGSPPNASVVAFHKNMGFAAGNDSNPSTLYFSDVGDIENWTTGISGNVALDTDDGSIIRSIIPGFDSLYIFKDTSIWRLSGDDKDNFQLQRMVSGIGCTSPNAVKRIGNSFFFTDGKGDSYIYDGAIRVQLISKNVEGTRDTANFSRWQYSVTEQFDKNFYISFSTSSASMHDSILLFDSFNQAWTRFSGINANAMTVADDGNGKDMLVFGDYGGLAYKYPSGTNDNGTAIDAFYTTKQYRFPELNPDKDWKLLNVYASQKGDYDLTVETRRDFEGTGTTENINLLGDSSLWDTAIFDTDIYGGQNVIIGRIEVNKEGKFFQVNFLNSNLDEPVEVKGFQIYVEQQDRL